MQNVIVICLDTFRTDLVGEGQKLSFVDTPNLDALKKQSVVFENAYGEGQPTIQMRRNLMTGMRSFPWNECPGDRGLWPNALGWHQIPEDHQTLAEHFFEAGYVTGFVADTYHMFKASQNFTRGFMQWSFIRGQEGDPLRTGPLDAVDVTGHVSAGKEGDPHPGLRQYLLNVLDRRKEEDYFTPRVFMTAASWLAENISRAPVFLWVDSFAPHEYWDPPYEFADRHYTSPAARNFIHPSQCDMTEEGIERTKALYFGYVTFVDKWIGCLLNKIEELGIADETTLVFITDHGTEIMDNGAFGKGKNGPRVYNAEINLWFRQPGQSPASIEPFVLSHHLTPTLLDLAGIQHDELDGRSLWPLVTGEAEQIDGDTIVHGWVNRACVRDSEWAYITDTLKADVEPLLFNRTSDLYETRNVAADHPEIVADRRKKLENYLGQPLPCDYKHNPDTRTQATLARNLQIRKELVNE